MLVNLCSVLALLLCLYVVAVSAGPKTQRSGDDTSVAFYPAAVWYGGGKARAPMLERIDNGSVERWGKDLDQIKATGFRAINCWVDWATAEPRPSESSFANLDLLLKLAQDRAACV